LKDQVPLATPRLMSESEVRGVPLDPEDPEGELPCVARVDESIETKQRPALVGGGGGGSGDGRGLPDSSTAPASASAETPLAFLLIALGLGVSGLILRRRPAAG